MRPPTHLGWTLPGLYPTIQNRGGHVTLYTRLPTVIVFSCPQGSLGTRLGGPPLVLPNRVKVGGSDINEEENRNTSSSSTTPRPVKEKKSVVYIYQLGHS